MRPRTERVRLHEGEKRKKKAGTRTETSPLQLLDTREAAAFLRVSTVTLAKWRLSGEGPRYRKHGSRVYYALADLIAWSDAQARSSTSEA